MRRIAWSLLVAGVGAAAALAACADVFGIHNASIDGGGDDGGLADVPYDYVTHDAIDIDVNTAVCDGGFAIADAAVWVSGNVGKDDGSCGSQAAPCATIGQALKNAIAGSLKVVYLDDSTFNESLTLDKTFAGFTIQGGFTAADAGWTPVCDNGVTKIYAPDDAGSAAIDIVSADGVTLRLFKVRSKSNGAAGLGESVYAIRVLGSKNVTIDNVSMQAQSGGAGRVGDAGGVASPCSTTNTGNGQSGPDGPGGSQGSLDPSGFSVRVAPNGTNGNAGGSKPGSDASCGKCVVGCF